MTIAIGSRFLYGSIEGALICADSRVVATDGATTWGSKTHLSLTPRGSAFAIAGAADDGDASNMLAGEITSALCGDDVEHLGKIKSVVTEKMTAWYSAYGSGRAPSIQYVLAAAVGHKCDMFFCSPPNTVLQRSVPFSVGQGARVVDPLITRLHDAKADSRSGHLEGSVLDVSGEER